ncbi:hypothetical protein [Marinicella meishanensis]|uniref:hypothetical protein n=1 Tax=Marinicella meishanensis TaxID=2873263 RepID=UPI001CBC36E8|nr:hypothetical protein [Marinicella sp. NBU2979]
MNSKQHQSHRSLCGLLAWMPTVAMGTGLPTGHWDLGFMVVLILVVMALIVVSINYILYQKFKLALNNKQAKKAKLTGVLTMVFNVFALLLLIGIAAIPVAAIGAYCLYVKYRQTLCGQSFGPPKE